MKNKKTVIVRMPEELYNFLEILSEEKFMTKSSYIRELVRQAKEDYDNKLIEKHNKVWS